MKVKVRSSTLIGNAKPTFENSSVDGDIINDTALRKMITEAAAGSEYSRKEE